MRSYAARGALGPRLTYVYGRVLLQLDQLAAPDSVLEPLSRVEGLHGIESLLGDIAARADRPEDARAHYKKAIAQTPEDCTPFASLALLDIQQANRDPHGAVAAELDSALAAAERVTTGENYRCNLLLGLAYLNQKRFADAIRHLEATRKLDPDGRDVLFNLAMAHQEQGDFDVALQLGRELLQAAPDDAQALNFVGYILAERGRDLAESEAMIRKALAIEPDNGYYVDSLGWVLYQKGDHAGAATALERAVRLTKEQDALILEHLGDAYVGSGSSPRRGASMRARRVSIRRAMRSPRSCGHRCASR
jgi:tetratricopeptide (TPR) repeat protein